LAQENILAVNSEKLRRWGEWSLLQALLAQELQQQGQAAEHKQALELEQQDWTAVHKRALELEQQDWTAVHKRAPELVQRLLVVPWSPPQFQRRQ
jgi:hypothetical protein